MDSRILRILFYLLVLFLLLAMCSGCAGDGVRVKERVSFISKTSEGVPVLLIGYRDVNSQIDERIIDNSLDELIAQYSLKELSESCESTVLDLSAYYKLEQLRLRVQEKYDISGDFSRDTFTCAKVSNKY